MTLNRETRRKVDLDARRGERKKAQIEATFLGKVWAFPASPSLRAVEAIENGKPILALRLLLGNEKADELLNDPAEPDADDLEFLLGDVYGEDALGEAPASSDS